MECSSLRRQARKLLEDNIFSATISASQFNELMSLSGLSDSGLRVTLLPLAASYSYSQLAQAVHAEQSKVCCFVCVVFLGMKS